MVMLFERESGEAEKDDAAFARTARRYMQKIAGVSRKQPLAGHHAEPDYLDAVKKVQSDSAVPGQLHAAVFGSDIYVLQGGLELAVQRKGNDALYSRPTMQAKRREAKINEIVTTAANLFASEGSRELLKKAYFAYRAIYVDLVREIDPTATARECLSRATRIVAQVEGVLIFTGRGSLSLPNLGDVLELIKVTAIDIAQGNRRSKEARRP